MKTGSFDTYKDGIATIKKELKKKIDLSSDKKEQEFIALGKIRFDIVSSRQQDCEFIESKGRVLSLKIKIPKNSIVSKEHTVSINERNYNIVEMDEDKIRNRIFLYLEKAVI